MAGKSQPFELTVDEDEKLRRFEQNGHIRVKVRLQAGVVRLNAAGWSRRKIAQHAGRTYGTICQDLKRWYERGIDGLADTPATNQPEKLTARMRELIREKLQKDRTWTCRQLVEVVKQGFAKAVSAEAMRKRMQELGYCWKRTRYVPCKRLDFEVERDIIINDDGYEIPMPEAPGLTEAQALTTALLARLYRLERSSQGRFKVVRTVRELEHCVETGVFAAVFHLEGAEAIDPEFEMLEVLYQAGLRSLGLVWSRPNRFGTGVSFKIPASPDAGPGLTDIGKRLVGRCNDLGIMIDLSHLNERGFWDVASLSRAPLVATHSNAHALCPAARNLTDAQLAAVRETNGVVGVNFSVTELRQDGYNDPDTPLNVVVRQVDYLIDKLGVEGVAFGSDFDGATLPQDLKDVTGFLKLIKALTQHGYDDVTLRKLCFENWLSVLGRSWRP